MRRVDRPAHPWCRHRWREYRKRPGECVRTRAKPGPLTCRSLRNRTIAALQAYIVGTLVATYRRVTAETSSWQIHEVDYAPNRRGILQNKRDNLREEAFKSLAKKGSIFYIEFFYVQLMFWTFVGSGSWVAAVSWDRGALHHGRQS